MPWLYMVNETREQLSKSLLLSLISSLSLRLWPLGKLDLICCTSVTSSHGLLRCTWFEMGCLSNTDIFKKTKKASPIKYKPMIQVCVLKRSKKERRKLMIFETLKPAEGVTQSIFFLPLTQNSTKKISRDEDPKVHHWTLFQVGSLSVWR